MVAIIRGGRARKEKSSSMMNLGDIQPIPEGMVEINGITMSAELLAHWIAAMTYPDPKKWYRFERRGNEVIVETKYEP